MALLASEGRHIGAMLKCQHAYYCHTYISERARHITTHIHAAAMLHNRPH